jgi:hypothetical protein
MKHMIRNSLVFLSLLLAGASLARAEEPLVNTLLYVGTLKDVNGFDGLPLPDGSHIEFRAMYNTGSGLALWKAYAPESQWVETRNPLKTTSKVGAGVIQSARGRGLFAACVPGLDTTNQYVARLFSGPTPEESVAYCDSRPFTFSGDQTRSVTNVQFGVWKAMDGSTLADTDGDGLVDLAETTLSNTETNNWDTDGDGFSDGFEHTHAMDPREPYQLAIRLIATPVDEELLEEGDSPMSYYDVAWPSVSGLTYHLEYVNDMQAGDEEWVGIATNLATDTNMVIPVDDWYLDNPRGFFRVWTVLPTNGVPPDSGEESAGE